MKSWVTKVVENKWAEEWHSAGQGETREFFLRRIKGDITKWADPKDHREQQKLSRLRTGHVGFAFNMGGGGDFKIMCSVCHVHHSVEHVLCHCPQYEGPRRQYAISENISNALGDDLSSIAAVFLFLKDTNLFFRI